MNIMHSCSLFVLLLLCAVAALVHSHGEADHSHGGHKEPAHFKYSREANVKQDKKLPRHSEPAGRIWAEVGLAILLISLAPLLVLCLLPNLQRHRSILKLLLAFAAGGLLGDAFLHLVPHAIEATQAAAAAGDHDHQHHHHHDDDDDSAHEKAGHSHGEYSNVGLSILFGIFTFLCVEKLIRLARGQPHHHHQTPSCVPAVAATEKLTKSTDSTGSSGDTVKKEAGGGGGGKKKKTKTSENQAVDKTGGKTKDAKVSTAMAGGRQAQELKVASYLNLTADFMHNFTDGLAIGASFLMSRSLGIVTTFTVLMHELPHEIGDYAILVQSGCSSRKAILLQLTTAVGAALGAALSLLAAGVGLESLPQLETPLANGLVGTVLSKVSTWLTEGLATGYLLAFTAGGFIYIAMTSVLPDLLEDEDGEGRHSRPGFLRRLVQTIGELLAITAGVVMMISLGMMEQAQGHI